MTAAVMSIFLEFKEETFKNNRMSNSCSETNGGGGGGGGGLQLTSTRPSSATESVLNPNVVGAPGLFQRRHSLSCTSAKSSGNQCGDSLNMDPSLLLGNRCSGNQETGFRVRSFSELGDRLRPVNPAYAGVSAQVNSNRYKTELCRPFEENGSCKYGDKCQFAHGMYELRSLSRHPKYKTEFCRTFHSVGFCPYGPRCHFIHNADERRGPPPLYTMRPQLQHSFSFPGFASSDGFEDGPTSVSPPAGFSSEDLTQCNSFSFSNQELSNLFGPCLGKPLSCDPHCLVPPSPITCSFNLASESPPSLPDSMSDQDGYQSSRESQSGSDSPLLDNSQRRLPIFSRLSISDD